MLFKFEFPGSVGWWSYLAGRSPLALPLVWLAIYAQRCHGQALRLEEEYAHKETISKSFEGYKGQLLEIEEGTENANALTTLIENTLNALAVHPARVYSGNQKDVTPLNTIKDAVSPEGSET